MRESKRSTGVVLAALVAIAPLSVAATAAGAAVWQDLGADALVSTAASGPRLLSPLHHRTLRLDASELREALSRAPLEVTGGGSSGLVFALPMPDGSMERFLVEESPIMEPGLAARYPDVRTYRGRGLDDPSARARFGVSRAGFHAIILSPRGTVYIDPYRRGDAEHHISYFTSDNVRSDLPPFSCQLLDSGGAGDHDVISNHREGVLRTYRLAQAATFEYVVYHSSPDPPSKALAVTRGIIPTINRMNAIYESDVGIHLNLVANNDTLIFDTLADPYSNDDGVTMLGQNISTCNSRIGLANYDIGHVFSTGGGGVAYLGVICNSLKGGGVTGNFAPLGDNFDVDYVAHEMGHQFGGNHSFNGNAGSCGGGNRNGITAYEVGSGASIMAYAGICGAQDLQPHSYDEFHGISLQEIIAYTNGSGGACAIQTPVANVAPEIDAGPSYTIPRGTPFALTAVASDADGDSIAYSWEEFDLGSAGAGTFDNGSSPILRSFKSTSNPTRTFPRWSNILSGSSTYGEILPTTTRTLNFRVIARDHHPVAGAVHWDATQVFVKSNSGPFVVTKPNGGEFWDSLTPQLVMWNVAGTDTGLVNTPTVDLLLSTDGGLTFTTVATGVPNDGSETLVAPVANTSLARLMVRGGNNVFFDVSNANFSILGRPFANLDVVSTGVGTPVTIDVLLNDSDPNGDPLTILAVDSPPASGGTAVVQDNGTPGDPSDDTIFYTPPVRFAGADSFTYVISDGALLDTAQVTATISPTSLAVGDRPEGAARDFGVRVRPNPALIAATVDFQLDRPGAVELGVFAIDGRRVASLVSGPLAAGAHSERWEGRGPDGARVRSGIYWVQLSAAGRTVTRRLVVMH